VFDLDTVSLIGGGRVDPNSRWAMPVHAHTSWEFVYFVRGSGRIDVPTQTLAPHAFHLVVYPPGLPHAEITNPIDPEETVFLVVDVAGSPPPNAHLLLPDPTGELGWLAERIVAECESGAITDLAKAYTRAFLCVVERVWANGVSVEHDAVDVAIQYIHTNYQSNIYLDTLAKAVCWSRTHLVHRFRARLGISPIRYLRKIRLENAKRLLATTNLPINKVATRVGFSDPLYFSRVFKHEFNTAPVDYRRQLNSAKLFISSASASIPKTDEQGI